jgi:hypothetical protein
MYTQLVEGEKDKYEDVIKIYPNGRPFKDHDLKKRYDFGANVSFKKGHIPDKSGTMYKVKVKLDDIKLLPTFPFEMIIKSTPKTKKIKYTPQMKKHSVDLYKSCIKDYIYLQSQ